MSSTFPILRTFASPQTNTCALPSSASPRTVASSLSTAAATSREDSTSDTAYHGQIWTAADPARSLGVSEPTVRRYLDTLTQTLMVRQLQPWHENLGKRQVKSPKVYFRDTGLLHALMDVESLTTLLVHPRCGASWEGFALEQVQRLAKPDEAYFRATHQGAESDLLLLKGARRVGVEFKRADAPRVTKSMHVAIQDLKLDVLYVVYPGEHRFNLEPGIEAVPLWALLPPASYATNARMRPPA